MPEDAFRLDPMANLPPDFVAYCYWAANPEVQDACALEETECLVRHWREVGDGAGLQCDCQGISLPSYHSSGWNPSVSSGGVPLSIPGGFSLPGGFSSGSSSSSGGGTSWSSGSSSSSGSGSGTSSSVSNNPPRILSWNASRPVVTVGDTVGFSLNIFDDPQGPEDVVAFLWWIGDNPPQGYGVNTPTSNVWSTPGTKRVLLRITDTQGLSDADSLWVAVLRGLPFVDAGEDWHSPAGVTLDLVGTASDPNTEGSMNADDGSIVSCRWDYEGTGTWSACSPATGYGGVIPGQFVGSYAYPNRGLLVDYATRFCATDDDGNEVCDTKHVFIAGTAPSSSTLRSSSGGSGSSPAGSSSAAEHNCTYQTTMAGGGLLDCPEQVYSTRTIGGKVWMTDNLNFGTMAYLPASQSDPTPTSAQKYCFGNDPANCASLGGLYQWHTAMGLPFVCNSTRYGLGECAASLTDSQGICPRGWHLPSDEEWSALDAWVDAANGGVSNDEGASLKSTSGWVGTPGNGTNEVWFNALPGGFTEMGSFGGGLSDGSGFWWTATEMGSNTAWYRALSGSHSYLYDGNYSKVDGFSVRCVKD